MTFPPADQTPSGVIAARVRARRRLIGLNRQQLAERCANAGTSRLTLAALTNIETGRPDSQGRRRREITVEELLVLAAALGVAADELLNGPSCDNCLGSPPPGYVCARCHRATPKETPDDAR